MEYVGLMLEIAFLLFGVFIYLFAIGKTKAKDQASQQRAEAFRKSNGWWMRIAGLAIVAIMLINIFIHVKQLVQ